MSPHFFTATLGEAATVNRERPHNIETIPQLLDVLARDHPNSPAVGIGIPGKDGEDWGSQVYTYSELSSASHAAAHHLAKQFPTHILPDESTKEPPVVAMLTDSSMDMLLCFFALIRMGYAVLMIAPQCDATALAHLLRLTSSPLLLATARLTPPPSTVPPSVSLLPLPSLSTGKIPEPSYPYPSPSYLNPSSIGFIHHTSGTTSGLPKPIYQPHSAATVHLPSLPPPSPISTLTTTPLYHGGVADLFRSLMSMSMIWFYPASIPVTAEGIIKAVETADRVLPETPVKLFSGVPYIQKLCAESDECVRMLARMDMVGVGGAKLPEEVGDYLVSKGVNLVSRYGSCECGFLMSSVRDFEHDKAWDYLRLPKEGVSESELVMEGKGESMFELIVGERWPHMAKRNRPNGSYATSDIFTPHPSILRAFKYLTRSDATVVLTNGKKFDPMPFEDGLRGIKGVKEAIIFGQNCEFPGVLVFTEDATVDIDLLYAKIDEVNTTMPPYARIRPEMMVVITDGRDWPKSSKGTALRNPAEVAFAKEIAAAYAKFETVEVGEKMPTGDLCKVKNVVREIVEQVTGVPLPDEEDFFTAGLDSIMVMEVRRKLLQKLDIDKPLPSNVVFEQRNIARLSQYLVASAPIPEVPVEDKMLEMVDRYSLKKPFADGRVILLTGATGALGSHILSYLCTPGLPSARPITRIICLIRGPDAPGRLTSALKSRHLDLPASDPKIEALTATMHEPFLGLSETTYHALQSSVTDIFHCAWPVNFLAPLESFHHALRGLSNLLDLARHCRQAHGARFIYASSIASVLAAPIPDQTDPAALKLLEKISSNPLDATPLGYSQSKWVAERIVSAAGGDIVRIGQLSGDTKSGVWNEEEAWPQMIRYAVEMKAVPELGGEMVGWLPVDKAAEAMVGVWLEGAKGGVWHVVNVHKVEWGTVAAAVRKWSGDAVRRVETREWLDMLHKQEGVKLMDLWEKAYGGPPDTKKEPEPTIDVSTTATVISEFAKGFSLTEEYLFKVFDNWVETGFLPAPPQRVAAA